MRFQFNSHGTMHYINLNDETTCTVFVTIWAGRLKWLCDYQSNYTVEGLGTPIMEFLQTTAVNLYHFQRVKGENILRTSHMIGAVVKKLDDFVKTVNVFSNSKLGRINHALVKIKQLVLNDIDAMGRMVNTYKQTYDSLLSDKIDHLLYFLDSADNNHDYLALRVTKWLGYQSLFHNRGIRNYGWNAFTQAMGVFDVLRHSLGEIKDINIMIPFTNLNDTVRKSLPSSLWSSNERRQKCKVLFSREQYRYIALTRDLDEVLNRWERRNTRGWWPDLMAARVTTLKKKNVALRQCLKEYRDTIYMALDEISSIQSVTADALTSGTNFDLQSFEESFKEDLKAISASGSWLYQQIGKYIIHNVSKLDLAKDLLRAKIRDDMVQYMETIFLKTDLEAISKLRTEARGLKTTMQNWFVAGLGAISHFLAYFERDEIEYKLRNLTLWRQPIVDLRSPQVLTHAYSFDETWRTWPVSVSLQNLITPEGLQYISNILDGYMTGINDALYEVQQTSLTRKDEAVAALDVLWREMQSCEQQSQIGDDFIR